MTSATVPWCRRLGRYQRVNFDWGVIGDTRYLRTNLQYQQYIPISRRFTLGLNAELGLGKGLGGRPYPIFKNFYGGGLGTVRAFDQGSLGPVDVTGAYLGGCQTPEPERRALPADPRHRQRPHTALVHSTPTSATSGATARN